MEKVGQIYRKIESGEYFKVKEIQNITTYYFTKKCLEGEWEFDGRRAQKNYLENNKNIYMLIEDTEKEFIIPVSRLSKIE